MAKKKTSKKKTSKKKTSKKKTSKKTASNKSTNKADVKKFKFGNQLRKFLGQADSLAGSISLALKPLHDKGKEKNDEIIKIIESSEREIDEQGRNLIKISDANSRLLINKINNSGKINTAQVILPRAFLVSAVSQYDVFTASIIRDVYQVKPNILLSSEKAYAISDIVNYPDIDSIKTDLIEEIIDKKLRDDHKSQIDWLRKSVGLNIDIPKNVYPKFLEIMQRRNLFVHCDGIVNIYYIENCRDAGYLLPKNIEVGKILDVKPNYFLDAICTLSFVAIFIQQILWRYLIPQEINTANEEMINLSVESIMNEHYELATLIIDMLLSKEFSKDLNTQQKLICYINTAQIYKWQDKEKEMFEYLEDKDFTGCGSDFNLCISVLKEDHSIVYELMKSLPPDTLITEQAYREWPIFRKLILENNFKKTFKKVYGKEFVKIESDEPFIKSLIEQANKIMN